MNFSDFFSFQKRIYFRLLGIAFLVTCLSSCQDCTFESDHITFARVQFHHRTSKDAFDKDAIDTAFLSVRAIHDFLKIDEKFVGRATLDPKETKLYNLPLFTSDKFSTFYFHP